MRKTKFILHGGFTPGNTNEDNSAFYREILKDAPDDAKILLVPFAKDADRVESCMAKTAGEFNAVNEGKSLKFETATEENLIEQVKSADVIYFHGGRSLQLREVLKKYEDLGPHMQGKTVAGESAGANCLCTFFYSPTADVVSEGLGILPIKMSPHYKEEYKEKLDSVGPNLEKLCLPEYEHVVIYV